MAPAEQRWFVYMLSCRGGRIYTGISPDVAARLAAHKAGKGGAFTRSFPPTRVLAALECAGRGEALKAEYALKQLTRAEKKVWVSANPWNVSSRPRRKPGEGSPRKPRKPTRQR